MAQKYKVYLNSHLIIFLFTEDFSLQVYPADLVHQDPSPLLMQGVVTALFDIEEPSKLTIFHSAELPGLWDSFQTIFEVIHAGGGLVKNQREEYLFIYRNGMWDLPKGKLDPGETIAQCALREVEEECGISNLTLGEKIKNTYHIYQFKGNIVLKYTHWYHMSYTGNEMLTPQLEEGITQVEWFNEADFTKVKENTYLNILEVIGVEL